MRAIAAKATSTVDAARPTKSSTQAGDNSNITRLPLWTQTTLPIQTSLKINAPGDKHEQEADRIAEQVMRMPDPQLQRATCSCGKPMESGGECADCKRKKLGIQRMASGDAPQTTAPPIVHQALQQPGRPLDGATRNFMETRFGQDFGHVRMHTGTQAAESADAVNAKAYTVGKNIVFGTNKFHINSNEGRHLLAHELVHSIQQNSNTDTIHRHLQRICQAESFYSASPNYCRDDTFSPSTHPGETCYRQIPSRSSYFSCPPGEHVCFDGDGNCDESPDRSSLAEGKESDGSCNWNGYCVAEHTAVDFVPEVADQAAEPFREIGREMYKALDWRNWLPLAGY